MNTPNKLTVLRMILVPFFVAALLAGNSLPHHNLIAFILFAAASYTDHLDGKLARSRNLITTFGKFMDPLADKIMVISALVCFVSLDVANVWLVLLIIFREFMVTSVRLVAADSGVVVAANNWGKAKTVSQIAAILAVLRSCLSCCSSICWSLSRSAFFPSLRCSAGARCSGLDSLAMFFFWWPR